MKISKLEKLMQICFDLYALTEDTGDRVEMCYLFERLANGSGVSFRKLYEYHKLTHRFILSMLASGVFEARDGKMFLAKGFL